MSIHKKYKTDKKIETQGFLLEYTDDFRMRLSRLGGTNDAYSKRYEELMKPYRRVPKGHVKPEILHKLVVQTFCETIIQPNSWQTYVDGQWVNGIEDENHEIVPATSDNLTRILMGLQDLFLELTEEARRLENFLVEDLKADTENLSNASNSP